MPLVVQPNGTLAEEPTPPSQAHKVLALVDGEMVEVYLEPDGSGGERDAAYPDSFDLVDVLAGELGPVRTQDSIALSEAFVAEEARLLDAFVAFDDGDFDLTARHVDSVGLLVDQIPAIIIADPMDTVTAGDGLDNTSTMIPESVGVDDAGGPIGLTSQSLDSVAMGDDSPIHLLTTQEDEAAWFSSSLIVPHPVLPEGLGASTARSDAVMGIQHYATDVESSLEFSNPTFATGNTPGTQAFAQVTQTGGLNPASQTKNISLVLSYADLGLTPSPSSVNVLQIVSTYATTESGGLQSGNSVSVDVDISKDDGATWSTATTLTSTDTGGPSQVGVPSSLRSLTYVQLQQFRIRFVGTITSGTTALTGGATQTFAVNIAHVDADLIQSL